MSAGRFPTYGQVKCESSVHGARAQTSQGLTPPPKDARAPGFCDAPIVPIFTQLALRRRRKGISDGEHDDVQKVKGQRMLSAEGWATPSPSALNKCLDHVQTSNPTFPVRTVFATLQKRAGAGRPRPSSTEVSPRSHVKGKRRRAGESSEAASKRQRCGSTGGAAAQDVEEARPVEHRPRGSGLSRTRRLGRQSSSSARPVSPSPAGPGFEDVLWTDKYSPRRPGEVVGNSLPVDKLHSWLRKWKARADADGRGREGDGTVCRLPSLADAWDRGDFQGEAGADGGRSLRNAVLITGPPGVGKTASVYACALELGFKVFEVNCSSQRGGRHLLSQLREATQSHLVETSGKDPPKPAYFQTYSAGGCSRKAETLPGNVAARPKNVTRATKSVRRRGKATGATAALAKYFMTKARADLLRFGGLSTTEKPNSNKVSDAWWDCDHAAPPSRKTATSLILFEEVDVIFEDDVGFLAAIKTFMTTTKRPVVLTTTDPSFRERFSCSLDEIVFKTPSHASVCSYLQLVALAEHVRLQADDVRSLLGLARGDVRRCLLQLQLWAHGGAGRASLGGSLHGEPVCAQRADAAQEGGCLDPTVPPWESGCAASLLGLRPVTQSQLLSCLKSQRRSDMDMNELLMLLADSWRQRLPLLYANLERLLPIGAFGSRVASPEHQTALPHSDTQLHSHQLGGRVMSKAPGSKHASSVSRLSRRKTSSSGVKRRSPASLHRATSGDAAPVEGDLFTALADFFDLMSYLDATLPAAAPLGSGPCGAQEFVWTGAEIKDGVWDERRDEEGRSCSQETLSHIQAAVEGLGFHKCAEAWTEARNSRQTMDEQRWETLVALPAASRTQSLSFSVQPLCAPGASQRRFELSRAVFGSESFGLLGNRRAVSVDYMPILRSICRFHRAQRQKEKPARYMNYMGGTCLGLSKSTMKLLAEDFS